MSTPTLNIPLAEAVLKQITEHPELHDQEVWGRRTDCGTTHCIAGWATVLSPDVTEYRWDGPSIGADLDGVVLAGDGFFDMFDAGQELLGLDSETAEHLFLDLDEAEAVDYLRELIAKAQALPAVTS